MEDGETEGMQFIFVNFFLLRQNDGVLKESLLRPKAEGDFPEGLHHFAKGEKN